MNVKLRFNSLFDLWQFKKTVQVPVAEVQAGEPTLTADLDDAEMELAKNGFQAEVINENYSERK